MNRTTTTLLLTTITFLLNYSVLGLWAVVSTPLVLSFPLYLIWVDSKLPADKQWRYYNRKSAHSKKGTQ